MGSIIIIVQRQRKKKRESQEDKTNVEPKAMLNKRKMTFTERRVICFSACDRECVSEWCHGVRANVQVRKEERE